MMKVSRSSSMSSEEGPSSPESILEISPQPSPNPHMDNVFEEDSPEYSPAMEEPQYSPAIEEPQYSPASSIDKPQHLPVMNQPQYSPAFRPDDAEGNNFFEYHQAAQVFNYQPYYDDDDSFGCQQDFFHAVQAGDTRNLNRILNKYSQLIQINRLDHDGQTALTQSCLDGNVENVKVLLHHGANPNQTNRDGFSPFHVACFQGRLDMVKHLMEGPRYARR